MLGADNDGPAQDVAEDRTSKWPREHPCEMQAFSFGPTNLSEAKLKSFGLIALSEISMQPGIDCVIPLLVVTLTPIQNEKEKAEHK